MEKVVSLENVVVGGMVPDPRDETPGASKLIKHFDILTKPRTIAPYHSQVTGDANAAVNKITDLLYSIDGTMFGMGVGGSPTRTRVYSSAGFTSTSWTNIANGTSASGDGVTGCFVEYHSFGYGFNTNSTVWACDLAGLVAWSDDAATGALSGAIGNVAVQGLVHSKDDCLYMATTSSISRNNNGSWTKNALTLPSRYTITCLSEYGNYLAIGCASNIGGNSVVYLWDRDSSLNTITEVIDWGTGQLRVLEQVEGELVGTSIRQDVASNLGSRIDTRRYYGGTPDLFHSLLASSLTGIYLKNGGQKQNQRLYFLAGIEIDGELHNGVWGVGKNKKGQWVVWFDRLPNNDTAIAAGSLKGFFVIGDFMYIAYNDGGYVMTMTSSSATAYAGSSIIETVINPGMDVVDKVTNKDLKVVALSYAPIPQGGQITLKYKTDADSNWTTIFTETTQGVLVSEAPYDTNGDALATGREFRFRIESKGGVMPTGFKYKYEPLLTLI